MNEQLVIEIGALARSLKDQLAPYDLELAVLDRFNKINHSITMLYLNGYIPASQAEKLRKKMVKSIQQAVTKRVKEKELEALGIKE